MDEKNGSVIGRIADLLGGVAGRVIVAALLILIAVELSRFCYSFGRSVFYQEQNFFSSYQFTTGQPSEVHVISLIISFDAPSSATE